MSIDDIVAAAVSLSFLAFVFGATLFVLYCIGVASGVFA